MATGAKADHGILQLLPKLGEITIPVEHNPLSYADDAVLRLGQR